MNMNINDSSNASQLAENSQKVHLSVVQSIRAFTITIWPTACVDAGGINGFFESCYTRKFVLSFTELYAICITQSKVKFF